MFITKREKAESEAPRGKPTGTLESEIRSAISWSCQDSALRAILVWECRDKTDDDEKDVEGAGFAGSSPSFLGRERAAVNVDVGPERRSPRYHESCLALESVKKAARRY